MVYNFVRLYQLTEHGNYQKHTENQIHFSSAQAQDFPAGHCFFLLAKLLYENPPPHIVIVTMSTDDLHDVCLPFLSNCIIQCESESYPLVNNQTTFYVCRDRVCLPPCNDLTIS